MKSIVSAGVLFVSTVSALALDPPAAPTLEQILDRFPSQAQLQAQVNEYKGAHQAEFAAAKADFDLAIRSMLTLEFPEPIRAKKMHAPPKKEPLPFYFERATILDQIERCGDAPVYSEWKQFYQQHLDDITVEETAALRLVCLDILLNGWDDWDNWESAKLRATRDTYPDLHLEYALRRLRVIKSQEDLDICNASVGPALRLIVDRSRRSTLRDSATTLVGRAGYKSKDTDILRFCIDRAIHSSDEPTRLNFLTIAGQISSALGTAKREFWVAYVESPDEWIRTMAIGGIVESIRKPRPGETPRPRDEELAQILRDVAQNDPSPKVRQFLQPRLQYYETSDARPTHQGGRIGDPPTPLP